MCGEGVCGPFITTLILYFVVLLLAAPFVSDSPLFFKYGVCQYYSVK